jgi:hypothetical protein
MFKKLSFLIFIALSLVVSIGRSQVSTLFSETFSSGTFTANNWQFPLGTTNWTVGSSNSPTGGSIPHAYFNWAPSVSNYSLALQTPTINATAINGPVTLDYLLLLNNYSNSSLEQLKVEYKAVTSSTWTLLYNYTNTLVATQNWSITNATLTGMSGQNFHVRFTAYGSLSFNINRWSLDNIYVKGTNCPVSMPSVSITGSPTMCAGTSISLTASGGGNSYTWSPVGGNGSVAVVSPTSNATYGLVSSLVGCTASPASAFKTVTVLTNSTSITISASNSSVCAGSPATLVASGASSYLWNTTSTSASIVVTPTSSTVYTVSNIDSQGCTVSTSASISASPIPTVAAYSSTSATCPGVSVSLLASGANAYSWTPGGSGAIISVGPFVPTTYTVVGTDNVGCSSTATVSIMVHPTVNISASSLVICPGETATLTGLASQTFTWNNTLNQQIFFATPSVTTVYTLAGSDMLNCVTTKTIALNVSQPPTVTLSSTSQSICIGQYATVVAAGAASYSWSQGSQTASLSISPLQSGNYTVVGTSSAGCTGTNSAAIFSIVVQPSPTVIISASHQSICAGNVFTISAAGANTYSWSFGSSAATATILALSNQTYTLYGTNQFSCSSQATYSIIVKAKPSLVVVASDTSLCLGESVNLLAAGAPTLIWSDGSTGQSFAGAPTTSTVYTVIGTNSEGCTDFKSTQISVHPNPIVTVVTDDSVLCLGNNTFLKAAGAVTYSWNTGNGAPVLAVSPTISTLYSVIGTDANGCKSTASLFQVVDECLGINESGRESAIIWPNPAADLLFISGPLLNGQISIYDEIGRLLLSTKSTGEVTSVNVSDWPNGIYFIELVTKNKKAQRTSFIKQTP